MREPIAWDLNWRDRSIAYHGRFEVVASLAVLTLLVVLALVGLALDGNWPKLGRVALSFFAYTIALVGGLKWAGEWRPSPSPSSPPSVKFFLFAAAVAGLVSGVAWREFSWLFLAASLVSAPLVGVVHWFAIRQIWRSLRHLAGGGRFTL